jgi:hypothetical protein
MGAGVAGCIPLKMKWTRSEMQPPHAWNELYTKEGLLFTIREDALITNYRAFLTEFYDLIQEDTSEWRLLDGIPEATNIEEFLNVWSFDVRNGRAPFIYNTGYMFKALNIDLDKLWLFYAGSYNAYLEEYSTLTHMELMLMKAMENPLKDIVRFGMFG